MSEPKISIIMGIYNCEKTLDEAIQSVISQTYKCWELIMCDDGSTDNTYKIAKGFEEKYPDKIKVIKNEKNLGLNQTLNNCLRIAAGKYIARMDGDDISLPTRFEKEIEFLETHPEFAVVSTPMIMFDENGDWGETKVIERPQINDFCTHTPFFCHAACMVKKSVYAKGYKGANLTEPLYKMRDDRNATHRRSLKARLNGCYVLYDGFKKLKMPWHKYIYVVRNVVVELIKCLIPISFYEYVHRKKAKREIN